MRASIKWIPTELDPHRMIAAPTLEAVREVLRGAAGKQAADGVTVPLAEHPMLGQVGGVARVEAVGIARIGRTSYVAYQLVGETLRELPVEVDPSAGVLRISRTPEGSGPVEVDEPHL